MKDVDRVEAARRCHAWTELDHADLVRRDGGYLVHAESDVAYKVYAGDAFSPSGTVVSDLTPLFFIVVDETVLVLERQPQTWSQLVYQRERARAR